MPHTLGRARIRREIEDEAVAVLDSGGMTVSDAFRMLMTRMA